MIFLLFVIVFVVRELFFFKFIVLSGLVAIPYVMRRAYNECELDLKIKRFFRFVFQPSIVFSIFHACMLPCTVLSATVVLFICVISHFALNSIPKLQFPFFRQIQFVKKTQLINRNLFNFDIKWNIGRASSYRIFWNSNRFFSILRFREIIVIHIWFHLDSSK